MSWDLLQRFIESDVFNSNPFLPVSYLSRYADHVGIHYVLCQKLRQFPYEDIEFFLPQLCHLIISVDNESMALEEFLLDLCEESVTAALLVRDLPDATVTRWTNRTGPKSKLTTFSNWIIQTFWLFQTYLYDLSSNPQTGAFQTCRRVYNKVQHIVFGLADRARHEKIKENVLPVTVLSSFVLASVAMPMIPKWAGPLAVAQARKPQPVTELIPETDEPVKTPTRAQTVTGATSKSRRAKDAKNPIAPLPGANGLKDGRPSPRSVPHLPTSTPLQKSRIVSESKRPSALELGSVEARLSSASLPLPSPQMTSRPSTPVSAGLTLRSNESGIHRRHSHNTKAVPDPADLSQTHKTKLLRQHYFRSQTQFLTALEGISNRLVIVPKQARMSALRAELALIARDLPAEVDVPVICPPTLVNGSPGKSRHHRIVRLNPAEATVLNSAEKVPYLMMVEVLREDFSFDPDTPDNNRLLTKLLDSSGKARRLFDLSSETSKIMPVARTPEPVVDSVFEPTSGDLGSSPLLMPEDDTFSRPMTKHHQVHTSQRLSSGATTSSTTLDAATPRTSGQSTSRSSSPGSRRKMTLTLPRNASADQPDFSALATHMRTASQMLAQLDATSGKRPRQEVAAIRAKIIASMQSLEEKSFDMDEQGPTFDTIIAKTNAGAPSTAFACQLIDVCHKIWLDAGVNVWVKLMRILVTGESSGLIETITNGVSLHSLKRSLTLASIESGQNPRHRIATLKDHFVKAFGQSDSEPYKAGVDAFKRSLAAYSVISYVLQLKDRHNGNVLIDSEGHIIHIDFGFMLSNSPGSVGFEAAPFKLTHEYVNVLGGLNSPDYDDYKRLCKQAFQALRRSADNIIDLVAMMGRDSKMPCFSVGVAQVTNTLRQRFQLHLSADEAEQFVETDLIAKSFGSYYTRLYDTFQYRTQGIY
ncbi:Phosphatidylinositol 4-kinase pik1 [Metarhizium anisopliae]|nr:Phosphatidylinositol 4-kinase pik1 [Metarhizium anisopliae]